MLYNNKLFSLVGALCIGGVVSTASAAPTVKKLGGSNGHLQSGAAVSVTSAPRLGNATTSSVSTASVGVPRTSSLRLGTSAKPVSVTKSGTATKATAAVNAVDANRLSIGKYIHDSGVNSGYIKPVSGVSQAESTSADVVSLMDRVADLESKLADLTLNVTNNYTTEAMVQEYIQSGTRANEVYDNAINAYTPVAFVDDFPEDFDFE